MAILQQGFPLTASNLQVYFDDFSTFLPSMSLIVFEVLQNGEYILSKIRRYLHTII